MELGILSGIFFILCFGIMLQILGGRASLSSLNVIDAQFKAVTEGIKILNKNVAMSTLQVINVICSEVKVRRMATNLVRKEIKSKGYCNFPFVCSIREFDIKGSIKLNSVDERVSKILLDQTKMLDFYTPISNFVFIVDVAELDNGDIGIKTSNIFSTDFLEDEETIDAYNSLVSKDNTVAYTIKNDVGNLITLEKYEKENKKEIDILSRINNIFKTYEEVIKANFEGIDNISKFEEDPIYLKAYGVYNKSSYLLVNKDPIVINKLSDDFEKLFNNMFRDKLIEFYRKK